MHDNKEAQMALKGGWTDDCISKTGSHNASD